MTRFDKVAKFNHDILGIEPSNVICLADLATNQLTAHQLKEEANEFIEAVTKLNIVEAVDAIMDNIYFAYGALYKMGISESAFDSMFAIIHSANMEKMIGKKEGREMHDSADAVKPVGWIPPEELLEAYIHDYNSN